ncbi:hypothetical protein [Clostridium sp. AF32-12BH]|uniref:hypothetical protein n=1 Tax=Clostridium sp. AF32-12BH TaxID=2292006 RepID=UPI0015FB9072|nr:hypothetical protein [Clostridium sp. AF32-12BH]
MNSYFVNCPCCGEKIKIVINDSGNATAFLLHQKKISQSELFEKFGITLGVESEVNK